MSLFKEKLDLIKVGVKNQLQPFLDNETVNSIRIIGSKKQKGTPKFPVLIVTADKFDVVENRGASDIWEGIISVAYNMIELKEPNKAVDDCETVISEVEDAIIADQSLGVEGVISVLPLGIEIVPYAFGKNKNTYGSGAKFSVKFLLPRFRKK